MEREPRRVTVGVMMMAVAAVAAVAAVDAVLPMDDPTEGEGDDPDDLYDPPGYLGHPLDPPNKPPLEDLGVLGVSLAPWVKPIYNGVYV